MNRILPTASLIVFGLMAAPALTVPGAQAADAANPYGNIDHTNDAGNRTGDSRIEGLNDNQLNQNYKGTIEPRSPPQQAEVPPGMPAPPQQAGVPPGIPAPPGRLHDNRAV